MAKDINEIGCVFSPLPAPHILPHCVRINSVRVGVAYFITSFAILTGAPIAGALLGPEDSNWGKPIAFSGVRPTSTCFLTCFSTTFRDRLKIADGRVGCLLCWDRVPRYVAGDVRETKRDEEIIVCKRLSHGGRRVPPRRSYCTLEHCGFTCIFTSRANSRNHTQHIQSLTVMRQTADFRPDHDISPKPLPTTSTTLADPNSDTDADLDLQPPVRPPSWKRIRTPTDASSEIWQKARWARQA